MSHAVLAGEDTNMNQSRIPDSEELSISCTKAQNRRFQIETVMNTKKNKRVPGIKKDTWMSMLGFRGREEINQ